MSLGIVSNTIALILGRFKMKRLIKLLKHLPCIKFRTWAISGRATLNHDLWHNKLARVTVWKKYFLIYDDYKK